MIDMEKTALDQLFKDLQLEKKELKENYRQDLAALNARQDALLDRYKRLDDWGREQVTKRQEPAEIATQATLARLEGMELPEGFKVAEMSEKLKEKAPRMKDAAEAVKLQQEKATNAQDNLNPITQAPPVNIVAEQLAPDLPIEDPKEKLFTGIREGQDKVKRYQCFYHCDNQRCRNKGKHYITPDTNKTYCHECGRSLKVRPATSKGWPEQDSYQNFFIAGARKTEEELAAAYANPMGTVDDALKKYEEERKKPSSGRALGPISLQGTQAQPQDGTRKDAAAEKQKGPNALPQTETKEKVLT